MSLRKIIVHSSLAAVMFGLATMGTKAHAADVPDATYTPFVTVSNIEQRGTSTDTHAYITLPGYTCNGGNAFYIDTAAVHYESMFSMVLSSLLSGRALRVKAYTCQIKFMQLQ